MKYCQAKFMVKLDQNYDEDDSTTALSYAIRIKYNEVLQMVSYAHRLR